MPASTDSSFDDAYRTLPNKERLKKVLPLMAFTYFLNKHGGLAETERAAKWRYWQFSDEHRRFPLVVQLLRYALGPKSYNEHKDLLACDPQPW